MCAATSTIRALLGALIALCAEAGAVQAAECRGMDHAGSTFTVCEVDAAQSDLRLFLRDPETGQPLGSFDNVDRMLARSGHRLGVAMNAGMYHPDRRPVGLYIEDGRKIAGLVETAGPGNFGLLPNGVFCIRKGRADVMETRRFARERPACRHATQSGPMLVIDGALHPRFLRESDSRFIRNGLGSSEDGRRVVLAISETPVNFHDFATLFRDVLDLPQALYLDGNISRLHAPGLNRHDGGFPMGPILGTVVPADDQTAPD
ncbi:hypothetical protein DQW77_08210 [Roseovarius sp. TE539]|nr:hypothetical protein DQW77_08210 [Roseovarius sp. TE539]